MLNGHALIIWDGSTAHDTVSIKGTLQYYDSRNNLVKTPLKLVIEVKGIPTSVSFDNPQLSVQKCCVKNIIYKLKNYGDADKFTWQFPAAWQKISGGGITDNFIELKPDNASGGVIKCKMELTCSTPAYFKEKPITVSRHEAVVNLVPNTSGLNNQFIAICPSKTYTYRIEPICGATTYSWNFPQSWQQNYGQIGGGPPPAHTFYQGSSNSNEVMVNTSLNPATGPISVTAYFAGCNSVTSNIENASILASPPASILFVNEDHEFFHCNQWKMCNQGGQIKIQNQTNDITDFKKGVDYFTFSIAPPRYFTSPQGAVQTKIVYRGDSDFGKTPLIQGGGSPTLLSVTATNCLGTSTPSSITIYDELREWCPGTPFWQPYPVGCECCEPSDDPYPLKTELSNNDFNVFPIPASSEIEITLPNANPAVCTLVDASGKIIEHFEMYNTKSIIHQFNAAIHQGVYTLKVAQNTEIYYVKVIIQR